MAARKQSRVLVAWVTGEHFIHCPSCRFQKMRQFVEKYERAYVMQAKEDIE